MALKSKKGKDEELPFDIPTYEDEEPKVEQVSFDELEYEAEVMTEEEVEKAEKPKQYFTITGKVQQYEPTWEKYGILDLEVGDEFTGTPEVTIFTKEDKSYNAMKLRLMDDGEILDLYFNFPKKDWPHVKNITKYFDFYRGCFDFIYSILRIRDERNVVDKNGDEIDRFKMVNLETFAKYVDQHERIGIKITEGNPDSEYNSWMITKME